MHNRIIIDTLLIDIDHFANSKLNRADFALEFIEKVESLEDLPFQMLDEARDWQYKIETEGDTSSPASEAQIRALKAWIRGLL